MGEQRNILVERGDAVPIKLEKERTLRFNLRALARFEDLRGYEIGSALAAEMSGNLGGAARFGVRGQIALVWAGLLHEEPTLLVEEVESLIDEFGEGETSTERLKNAGFLALKAYIASQFPPGERKALLEILEKGREALETLGRETTADGTGTEPSDSPSESSDSLTENSGTSPPESSESSRKDTSDEINAEESSSDSSSRPPTSPGE